MFNNAEPSIPRGGRTDLMRVGLRSKTCVDGEFQPLLDNMNYVGKVCSQTPANFPDIILRV